MLHRVFRGVRLVALAILSLSALGTTAAAVHTARTGTWRGVGGHWGGANGERFYFGVALHMGEIFTLFARDSEGPPVASLYAWDSWESAAFGRWAGYLPLPGDWHVEVWDTGPESRGPRGFTNDYGGRGFWVFVPASFPPIVFGAWPLIALARFGIRRARRRWRQSHGRCVHCGYNLTGLSSPQCPECGTAYAPEHEVAAAKRRNKDEVRQDGSNPGACSAPDR